MSTQVGAHARDGAVGLPREIAPGVFWLGDCLKVRYQGRLLHAYNSVYVLAGDDCSMVIEAGHPQDLQTIEAQLESLIADGLPELRYVFLTHTETPHCAGVGRLLERYPSVVACGDVSDLHLVFPQFTDRFVRLDPGDEIDLGGTRFVAVEAVFRDLVTTRWGFDTRRRVLFAGDGFSYSHYHDEGHCGALAEEADELALPDMVALFAELAFYWTRFVDLDPYIERLDELLRRELDVALIAPTHGLPLGDPERTLPTIYEGLRLGKRRAGTEQVT
ncbi:MAG TPA: MBL fold metallo-hydrolase [Conexibacter sp.]|nr:MBL fold metallo-hydrolase [Conexibacter sp.]